MICSLVPWMDHRRCKWQEDCYVKLQCDQFLGCPPRSATREGRGWKCRGPCGLMGEVSPHHAYFHHWIFMIKILAWPGQNTLNNSWSSLVCSIVFCYLKVGRAPQLAKYRWKVLFVSCLIINQNKNKKNKRKRRCKLDYQGRVQRT